MAEWKHMEATWYQHHYRSCIVKDGYVQYVSADKVTTEHVLTFSDWLDYYCGGGWEVFKISRNFQAENEQTWCLFRKKE